jgi:hypothetical protein
MTWNGTLSGKREVIFIKVVKRTAWTEIVCGEDRDHHGRAEGLQKFLISKVK